MTMKTSAAYLALLFAQTLALSHHRHIGSRRELIQNSVVVALGGLGLPDHAAMANDVVGGEVRFGQEDLMFKKSHGTTDQAVQSDLLFGVSNKLADRICSFNRIFAEPAGYFQTTGFLEVMRSTQEPVTFYDSVSGKPLFKAPINRSVDEFIAESKFHGWPSFRDEEVIWSNVRVLRSSGETVSVDGTHLGHNLPDWHGNRYCINLVSIAGRKS